MDLTGYSSEYIAKHITNNVLSGLSKSELLRESYGYYRIMLPPLPDYVSDLDALWFFVPQDDVHMCYKDPKYSVKLSYDAVLKNKEYVLYFITLSGVEGKRVVHRDVLMNLYYAAYPRFTENKGDKMLFGVDKVCLSNYRDGYPYREVNMFSGLIVPGCFIRFFVAETDIQWIPKRDMIRAGEYTDSDMIEPFVNICLNQNGYQVVTKSQDTYWKNQVISVSRELLVQDHMTVLRAMAAGVSVDVYRQWLQQEYAELKEMGVGLQPDEAEEIE